MKKYKKLGGYIQPVDIRNSDLQVSHLLGLSIEKCFIESIANTIGTDFRPYKIVKKGQFAYGPVTSRNGDKITIALLKEVDVLYNFKFIFGFRNNRYIKTSSRLSYVVVQSSRV